LPASRTAQARKEAVVQAPPRVRRPVPDGARAVPGSRRSRVAPVRDAKPAAATPRPAASSSAPRPAVTSVLLTPASLSGTPLTAAPEAPMADRKALSPAESLSSVIVGGPTGGPTDMPGRGSA